MEELKIQKEKVIEAAKRCPTAKEVLETLFPEAFFNERPIAKIGDHFRIVQSDYILAQTEIRKVALISLETGNRWKDPVTVINVLSITFEDFRNILREEIATTEMILQTKH